MRAARSGHWECAKSILAAGADPCREDLRGNTPLSHVINGSRCPKCASQLLQAGALDANARKAILKHFIVQFSAWKIDTELLLILRMVIMYGGRVEA